MTLLPLWLASPNSYDKEDRCKLRYLYPSGYRTVYDYRLGRYNLTAQREAWGYPSNDQFFFSDTHGMISVTHICPLMSPHVVMMMIVGVSSMLLVYSVWPISFAIFWFFFACAVLLPHFLCYGLYSKTMTTAQWSRRIKQCNQPLQ
jgi:hypothetical protein